MKLEAHSSRSVDV